MANAIWNRKDPLFSAHEVRSRNQHNFHRQIWCYAGFKVDGVFAQLYLTLDYLYRFLNRLTCTVVTVTWTNRMVFENLLLLISRIAVVVCMRVLVQRGYHLCRKPTYSPNYLSASVQLDEGIIVLSHACFE